MKKRDILLEQLSDVKNVQADDVYYPGQYAPLDLSIYYPGGMVP